MDDPAAVEDVIEHTESTESEIAVVGDEVDLADLYTEPYLYLEPHTRAQCFAPNRLITVVPGEDAPHCVEITEFKVCLDPGRPTMLRKQSSKPQLITLPVSNSLTIVYTLYIIH